MRRGIGGGLLAAATALAASMPSLLVEGPAAPPRLVAPPDVGRTVVEAEPGTPAVALAAGRAAPRLDPSATARPPRPASVLSPPPTVEPPPPSARAHTAPRAPSGRAVTVVRPAAPAGSPARPRPRISLDTATPRADVPTAEPEPAPARSLLAGRRPSGHGPPRGRVVIDDAPRRQKPPEPQQQGEEHGRSAEAREAPRAGPPASVPKGRPTTG